MAVITQTNTIARIQILNPTDAAPTVQRWMNQQNLADGAPIGPPQFLQLVDRPLSSFTAVADLSAIAASDIPSH